MIRRLGSTPLSSGRLFPLFMLAGALLVGAPSRAAVTDEQFADLLDEIKAYVDDYRNSGEKINARIYNDIVKQVFADVAIDELTVDQIELGSRQLLRTGLRPHTIERLRNLSDQPDVEGARASVKFLRLFPRDEDPDSIRIPLERTLRHPALGDALAQGYAADLFIALARQWYAAVAAEILGDDLAALAGMIPDDASAELVRRSLALFDVCNELETPNASTTRRAIRRRILALVESGTNRANRSNNTEDLAILRITRTYLEGADARGRLLGYRLPALDISWSSTPEITSMEDLEGNVVVLDFWATWCTPCVKSMPHMQELLERYSGFPVSLVGATSYQGLHVDIDGTRIDTSTNPRLELQLMEQLIRDREMTWPVIFTRQSVYNTDFGIRGIPYVAIIDPTGKVRKVGLHPTDDAARIVSIIDALLEEANLPGPTGAE